MEAAAAEGQAHEGSAAATAAIQGQVAESPDLVEKSRFDAAVLGSGGAALAGKDAEEVLEEEE